MDRWLFIGSIHNSCGTGFDFRYHEGNKCVAERQYYGYSKRESMKRFREDMGLKGKHINIIDLVREGERKVVKVMG